MSNDTLDRELRELLRGSVSTSSAALMPDPLGAIRQRVAKRRARRRTARVAGGAISVGLVATVALVAVNRDDAEHIDVVPPATSVSSAPIESTVTPPSAAETMEGVREMPPPPLDVRGTPAMAWTGTELVIWGGDVEAANMGLPGPDRVFNDGAALDPASGEWRLLSPSPLPGSPDASPVAAMTDEGLVVTSGGETAIWDSATNTWRSLADAPGTVTDVTAVGTSVVSYSATAVLDVITGEWRELPGPPLHFQRPTIARTESELIVIGGVGGSAAAIALDPVRGEWRRLADPPTELHSEALAADWDGERVVVVNYDMRAAAYDPVTDIWTTLPSVPARFYEWYPTLRSTGDNTIVFMGQAAVVLTEDDRWVPLPTWTEGWDSVTSTRTGPRAEQSGADLFILGFDDDANVLRSVDVDGLVAHARRLQVGVVSIALPDEYTLAASRIEFEDLLRETVSIELATLDGASCSVSSGYGGGTTGVSQLLEETLDNDGEPTAWFHNSEGTIWQNAATTSDTVTIECSDAEVAEALARSVSFNWSGI